MRPDLFHTPPDRGLHIGWFPMPQVERVTIPGAPRCMDGLRALFVSDVHLRRSVSDEKLRALIELIRGQQADLLLLGGDYAETENQCARFFEALQDIRFRHGCFAVPGNNDPMDTDLLCSMMASSGATLLKNLACQVELPGGVLEIAGCDEHKYGSPKTSGLFTGAADYRVLLSHFPAMPDCACELMLSGHTHGGQFNLLGVTPYSIGFEHSFRLLAVRGLHQIGAMRLLVGSGIGVSRLPLRIGAAPHIYLLKFSPELSC